MTVSSTFIASIRALLRNPTRAMLTTLGIVIGIAAVITMMEIGEGSAAARKKNITGVLNDFLSTGEGLTAIVSAAISDVLHITEPIAFP